MQESVMGFTIDELIERLQLVKSKVGNVEVMLPQVGDEKENDGDVAEWDAHITDIYVQKNYHGDMVVKIC